MPNLWPTFVDFFPLKLETQQSGRPMCKYVNSLTHWSISQSGNLGTRWWPVMSGGQRTPRFSVTLNLTAKLLAAKVMILESATFRHSTVSQGNDLQPRAAFVWTMPNSRKCDAPLISKFVVRELIELISHFVSHRSHRGDSRVSLTFKFIQVFSWFHTSRADRFEMRSEVLALNFDWFLFLEREKKSWIFAEWQHGNFFWAPISHSSQCPTSEWFVHFLVSQKIESWRKWHLLTFSFDEKSRKFGGRRAWAQLPWAHHRTTSWTFSNKVKRMNFVELQRPSFGCHGNRTGEPLICVPRPAHSDGRLLHRL